jgi:lactoylglutathione lyase
MKYLHTMIRVSDPDETLRFFDLLGLREVRRMDNEQGRYTLIFLAAPGDEAAQVELTHNWDESDGYEGGRNFGHLAYRVENIYETCQRLMDAGHHHQPPRRATATWPSSRTPGRHLDRIAPGRPPRPAGALGLDAEQRHMVDAAPGLLVNIDVPDIEAASPSTPPRSASQSVGASIPRSSSSSAARHPSTSSRRRRARPSARRVATVVAIRVIGAPSILISWSTTWTERSRGQSRRARCRRARPATRPTEDSPCSPIPSAMVFLPHTIQRTRLRCPLD